MKICSAALSANAGVSITMSGKRIWVDCLNDTGALGYSSVSQELLEKMFKGFMFSSPDMICFTHCHNDHYSDSLVMKAKNKWPDCILAIPQDRIQGQFLINDKSTIDLGDISVLFTRTQHAGKESYWTDHYGISIFDGESTVIIPGDCKIADPAVSYMYGDRKVGLAILNFPWVTLKCGRRFICDVMKPEHVFVFHLPCEGDDVIGYRKAAIKGAELLRKEGIDTVILSEPLQSESVLI